MTEVTTKELCDQADAVRASTRDENRVWDFWRAACDGVVSRSWAYARCHVAEYDISCGRVEQGLSLLAPVLAAPVGAVGARAHAVARAVTAWGRGCLQQPLDLDDTADIAAACELADEPYYAAIPQSYLASVARDAGDLDRAIRLYRRAFENYEKVGSINALHMRLRVAAALRQRGDDALAIAELMWPAAIIGRQNVSGWQHVHNEVIAMRADIHAAAALRRGSGAGAVAHYQHALELSGPIGEDGPRRDQKRLIEKRDQVGLDPGDRSLVVTLDDLDRIKLALSTRSYEAVLLVANDILATPIEISHPRTWLVASLAREVSRDVLALDVDLDVLADSSWHLHLLCRVVTDPPLRALAEQGREALRRHVASTSRVTPVR